ncbi:MAG: hypothetical protein MZV64_25175 [Ignavibacteriales bacterium]|nr:hypothetical protein [Ignavibacteriales bacterium]
MRPARRQAGARGPGRHADPPADLPAAATSTPCASAAPCGKLRLRTAGARGDRSARTGCSGWSPTSPP